MMHFGPVPGVAGQVEGRDWSERNLVTRISDDENMIKHPLSSAFKAMYVPPHGLQCPSQPKWTTSKTRQCITRSKVATTSTSTRPMKVTSSIPATKLTVI